MAQPHWDPFEGISSLGREIDQLLKQFLAGGAPWHRHAGTPPPAVEMVDTPGMIVVRVQVPGVKKDDLQLTVHDHSLTIKGEAKADEPAAETNVYQGEFRYGPFFRQVDLPVAVQSDQTTAQLKDGILTILLPKKAEAQGREVPIQM
jgi:HSP20 family protein